MTKQVSYQAALAVAQAPMKPAAVILALDASSTTIGWCLYAAEPHAHGTVLLPAREIAERCMQAQQALDRLLDRHPAIDVIAIESPVARFAKALIPQARVSGALLAVAAARALPVVEVAPTVAKRILTGRGDADKVAMQAAAATYRIIGEHAADALGIALAACIRVRVSV
jgi:Holliday junction resolvasome RuvABC endonuclease subunit